MAGPNKRKPDPERDSRDGTGQSGGRDIERDVQERRPDDVETDSGRDMQERRPHRDDV